MNPTISRLTPEDADLLRTLSIQTFSETYGVYNTPENMSMYIDKDLSKEQLTCELEDPLNQFYVLKADDLPIGFVKLALANSSFVGDHLKGMEIARIYVLQKFQGLKLGKALLDLSFNRAQYEKCHYIWLGVWVNNQNARGFYEKMGFTEIGEQYFKLGNDLQRDLVLMKKW